MLTKPPIESLCQRPNFMSTYRVAQLSVLIVGTFNQEKAIEGVFSVIVKSLRTCFQVLCPVPVCRHQPYWWCRDGANTCYMRRWRGGQHLQETAASPGLLPWPASPLPWPLLRLVLGGGGNLCHCRGWASAGRGLVRAGRGLGED